jgi:protein phosphatase
MKYEILLPQTIHEMGQRDNQEDSIFPSEEQASVDNRLFILCDGMGGHDSGEVASQTVCQALSDYILKNFPADEVFTDAQLREALAVANARLEEKDNGAAKKMGTTLTFLYLHRGGATVAHIGDSRVYHLRPETDEILYRTRDHSLIYDLFDVGELTLPEMETSPNKNIITRVMMPGQEQAPKPEIAHITDIKSGDYFYLCSDGMLEEMRDIDIIDILKDNDLTEAGKRNKLVAATTNSQDNHSGLLIKIQTVTSEPATAPFEDTEKEMRQRNRVLMAELNPALAAAPPAAPGMPPVPNMGMPTPPPAPSMEGQEPYAEEVEELEGGSYDYSIEDSEEDMMSMQGPPQMSMRQQQPVQKSNSMVRVLSMIGLVVVVAIAGFLIYSTLVKDKDKDKDKENKVETVKDAFDHKSSAPSRNISPERRIDNRPSAPETSSKSNNTSSKESASKKNEEKMIKAVEKSIDKEPKKGFDDFVKDQEKNKKKTESKPKTESKKGNQGGEIDVPTIKKGVSEAMD